MSLINSENPEWRDTSRLVSGIRRLAESLENNRFWSYTTSEKIIKTHPWKYNILPFGFDNELAVILLEYYRTNPTEIQVMDNKQKVHEEYITFQETGKLEVL